VASFIVNDNHRWGGCVELQPTYRLRGSARVTNDVMEAAAPAQRVMS
jgi:hypothetical protein